MISCLSSSQLAFCYEDTRECSCTPTARQWNTTTDRAQNAVRPCPHIIASDGTARVAVLRIHGPNFENIDPWLRIIRMSVFMQLLVMSRWDCLAQTPSTWHKVLHNASDRLASFFAGDATKYAQCTGTIGCKYLRRPCSASLVEVAVDWYHAAPRWVRCLRCLRKRSAFSQAQAALGLCDSFTGVLCDPSARTMMAAFGKAEMQHARLWHRVHQAHIDPGTYLPQTQNADFANEATIRAFLIRCTVTATEPEGHPPRITNSGQRRIRQSDHRAALLK